MVNIEGKSRSFRDKSGPGHKLLDRHLHTVIPNSTGEDHQKLQEQSMSAIIQDKRTQVPS